MSGFAPHRAILYVLSLAFTAGLFAQDANAAIDAYLKFEGIQGESRETAHQGWIEVSSFQWGVGRSASMGSATGGAGKVSVSEIHITKTVDGTSPLLMRACASGQYFKNAVLEVRAHGGRNETITLENVLISSVQSGRDGEVPTESITLNFEKSTISYSPASMEHMQTAPRAVRPQVTEPLPH